MEDLRRGDDALPAPEPSPAPLPRPDPSHEGNYQPADAGPLLELEHMQRRLATLPAIEQSKGILMASYGIDAAAAFALLQRWSQTTNTKLVRISEALVATAGRPGGGDALRQLLANRPFDLQVEPEDHG